jgi:hypothetical protein
MWSVIPAVTHQPAVELVPSNTDEGLALWSWPVGSTAAIRWGVYSCDTETTFTDVSGVCCGAIHALITTDFVGGWIRFRLGPRYSVRVNGFVITPDDNGDTEIFGHSNFLRASSGGEIAATYSIDDNDEPIDSGNFFWVVRSIEAGYVLTDDGPRMYVHIVAGDPAGGSRRPFHFGAGTLHRLVAVDEASIFGGLTIEMEQCSIFSAAMHHGPFLSRCDYKPDTSDAKRDRQGTTVASLRSAALNFGYPVAVRVVSNDDLESNTRIALADCAGHPEFFSNSFTFGGAPRYVNALAGQPETDVAYTHRPDVAWHSNLSPDDEENETLARISVTMAGATLSFDGSRVVPQVVWAAATTNGNGNNEYTAFSSTPVNVTNIGGGTAFTLARQNVLVTIEVRETFGNRQAAALADVTLITTCRVQITAWFRRQDNSTIYRVNGIETLTAEQFSDLLAGEPVEIAARGLDGGLTTFTIQGIGPA